MNTEQNIYDNILQFLQLQIISIHYALNYKSSITGLFLLIFLSSLTLFHIASEPTYFTLGGEVSSPPPSNFVSFKDRNLKFNDDVFF